MIGAWDHYPDWEEADYYAQREAEEASFYERYGDEIDGRAIPVADDVPPGR